MKAKSALSLAVVAGVAASATAGTTPANRSLVPLQKAGVLYVNMQTGERSLTLYDTEAGQIPQVDVSASQHTAVLFDWWMSIDENICWDDPRRDGFGYPADTTADTATEPAGMVDFGDMPFNSKITGVVMNTAVLATENTDSNGDSVLDTGLDIVTVYYDALDELNRTSVAPPTAAIRIESIPGNRGVVTGGFDDYDVILDFGGAHFELGDDNGLDLGSLWMTGAASGWDASTMILTTSCTPSATGTTPSASGCTLVTITNPSPDGMADFQYMQYYAQHGTDDKVTADSTYVGLSSPDGQVSTSSYLTVVLTTVTTPSGGTSQVSTTITAYNTFITLDPLPQGKGIRESIGFVYLGAGGNVGDLDGSAGGCCYWFGGVDCGGFLAQVVSSVDYDPTWYNFNPIAQWGGGLYSDEPTNCGIIDFNPDGFIDNGDIGAFVGLFIAQDPSTDLNGDNVVDNGDIGTFVQLFLACTG